MAKTVKKEVKEKIREKTCWYCKQGIQYTDSEITITTAPITRGGDIGDFKNLDCPNCKKTLTWLK